VFPQGQKMSTMAVDSEDIDGDGDLDLFVGERIKVGKYGAKCSGFILENDGTGKFKGVTKAYYPGLSDIGMITAAEWCDLNSDNRPDLVVVGEFMEVQLLINEGGRLQKMTLPFAHSGLWTALKVVDVDGDQKNDIVLGNLGTNSRIKGNAEHPLRLYYNDFDNNNFPESILTFNAEDGKDYPYALRHNLTDQLRYLKKKYPDFESFKDDDITQIFDEAQLANTEVLEANELRSVVLRNMGNGEFKKEVLPVSVQFSPVYAIETADINKDGRPDLLMGGNLFKVQPEIGIYDASYGSCLINTGNGAFTD
ncbi:MAG: VCBS repeat-containing protein, partial [Mameliella sp.]|nr:VCBS repeat-containing protein [Phaeodactylibacter sp.]